MDFIERIFNLSPDGGTGTLELALSLVPLLLFALIALHRRSRS
jgi:hypothetical protein